jgi:hypothetical protein
MRVRPPDLLVAYQCSPVKAPSPLILAFRLAGEECSVELSEHDSFPSLDADRVVSRTKPIRCEIVVVAMPFSPNTMDLGV